VHKHVFSCKGHGAEVRALRCGRWYSGQVMVRFARGNGQVTFAEVR
jgi:hypothetical protein